MRWSEELCWRGWDFITTANHPSLLPAEHSTPPLNVARGNIAAYTIFRFCSNQMKMTTTQNMRNRFKQENLFPGTVPFSLKLMNIQKVFFFNGELIWLISVLILENIFGSRWPAAPIGPVAVAKGSETRRGIWIEKRPFHGRPPSTMEVRRGSWPLTRANANGAPLLRYAPRE